MTLEEVKEKLKPIFEKSRVSYAGVFGSVARGEATDKSDVDILVKFDGPATFSTYLELDENIKKTLGKEVDVITEGSVNKFLRPFIEKDLKLIYGQR